MLFLSGLPLRFWILGWLAYLVPGSKLGLKDVGDIMIGLVLRSSSRCLSGWSDFMWLGVGDRLFEGLWFIRFIVRGLWLLFVKVLIALVNNIGRFRVDFGRIFDRQVDSLIKGVEIKTNFSYLPLEQWQVRSWCEIDIIFNRNSVS